MCSNVYGRNHKNAWWVTSFSCRRSNIILCNMCVRALFQGLDAVCCDCVINSLRSRLVRDNYHIYTSKLALVPQLPIHPFPRRWCACKREACDCKYFCIVCWCSPSRKGMRICSQFALVGQTTLILRYAGICNNCMIYLSSFVPNVIHRLKDWFGDNVLHLEFSVHFDVFGAILPSVGNVVSQLVVHDVPHNQYESNGDHMSELCQGALAYQC
jgi:hypothetical protein